MRMLSRIALFLSVVVGLVTFSPVRVRAAEPLHVAAAISLKDALEAIARQYAVDTGGRVEFTFGASGQLLAQAKNGAPIDIFISAAEAQVDALEKDNLAVAGSRQIIATNELVVIVPAASKDAPKDLPDLASPRFRRLAIGEPKTVPAGQYAQQALASSGMEQKLRERLVYGLNVRQVLEYVARAEVDAGIVYRSDTRSGPAGDKVKAAFAIAESAHDPIVYPAVILRTSRDEQAARGFLEYLAKPQAAETFAQWGFGPIPARAARIKRRRPRRIHSRRNERAHAD
jgi:molybdate transport system substrate-binding protein